MNDDPGGVARNGAGAAASGSPAGGAAPERARPAPSLAVDVGGVAFATPVLGASGCFNSGKELSRLVDLAAVGGVVTKSVTLHPRKGLPVPRMAETAAGMLNAIGLQNVGVEEFLAKDVPFIAEARTPVVVSIAGSSVEEYIQVALQVGRIPGVVAIEANISCPNVERRNQVFACHPDQASEVIGGLSRIATVPVFAKLTADVTNIVAVAEACVRAGAHGLSLINTLLGMAIDHETFRPKLGAITGGLSGPAIKPVAIRCVYQVAQAFPEIPIMGIGGITSWTDAVEFFLAGAWAVQVGTANFFNPHATVDVAEGIREFLARKNLPSPAALRGRLQAPLAGPRAGPRARVSDPRARPSDPRAGASGP